MRIDNFIGKFDLIVVAVQIGTYSPQCQCDQKKCGDGQPVPK
jgi:hypothetical protein